MTQPSSVSETSSSPIGILSDLILWVLILAVMGVITYWGFYLPAKKHPYQTISLPFPDANEIIKGSQVKMMGTNIGYVTDIVLQDDHVDIQIRNEDKNLIIPSGSSFTVLFNGLGGAKSIEVVPPNIPQPIQAGVAKYIVENPIRLKDAQQYQIDIAQSLQKGAENFADFFGKKKPVEELQYNIQTTQRVTASLNRQATRVQPLLNKKVRIIQKAVNGINEAVNDFRVATAHAKVISDPGYYKTSPHRLLRYLGLTFYEEESSLLEVKYNRRIEQINQRLLGVAETSQNWRQKVDKAPVARFLTTKEQQLVRINQALVKSETWVSPHFLELVAQARLTLQKWNQAFVERFKP